MNKIIENFSFKISELNPNSSEEIEWVASRILQTLVEVLGEEKDRSLNNME